MLVYSRPKDIVEFEKELCAVLRNYRTEPERRLRFSGVRVSEHNPSRIVVPLHAEPGKKLNADLEYTNAEFLVELTLRDSEPRILNYYKCEGKCKDGFLRHIPVDPSEIATRKRKDIFPYVLSSLKNHWERYGSGVV